MVVTVAAVVVVVVVVVVGRTNTTEQSPSWEAKMSSASHIPHILWNLEIHDCMYNSLPPVPILNQMNPVQAPPPHPTNFFEIHFNIILIAMPMFSLSVSLPKQTHLAPLLFPHTCYMFSQSHSS